MKLSINGIKNTTDWEKAGIKLPSYDVERLQRIQKSHLYGYILVLAIFSGYSLVELQIHY